MSALPLSGIRIVDFSWVVAGPMCTKLLGIMGAEVVKVESRERLDTLRINRTGANGPNGFNRNSGFNALNYGKLGCTINLSNSQGVDLVKQLVEVSDVVIENFGRGVLERWGLDYATLRQLRPDIIYLSSSGLGRTGPLADYVCYGNTLHAYSGLTYLTGYLGQRPRSIGGAWSDPVTAHFAAFILLAALHYRRETGKGAYIDLSMAEGTALLLPEALMDYFMNGRTGGPVGNLYPGMAPHNTYLCKGDDKWVAIAVSSNEEWEVLCRVAGHSEWTQDTRFTDVVLRQKNREELDALIGGWTRQHTAGEVTRMLQEAGVACGPSYDTEDLASDPQLSHRGAFVQIDHPELGNLLYTRQPWTITPNSDARYEPAPLLGQHNGYVIQELLGVSEDAYRRLEEAQVVH